MSLKFLGGFLPSERGTPTRCGIRRTQSIILELRRTGALQNAARNIHASVLTQSGEKIPIRFEKSARNHPFMGFFGGRICRRLCFEFKPRANALQSRSDRDRDARSLESEPDHYWISARLSADDGR